MAIADADQMACSARESSATTNRLKKPTTDMAFPMTLLIFAFIV